MGIGDAAGWAQAAVAGLALLFGLMSWILREIRSSRTESSSGRDRLHVRLDGILDEVVSRREYDPTIKSLEHAIEEWTRSISTLTTQIEQARIEAADIRLSLAEHASSCPHKPQSPRRAATPQHRGQ